MGFVDDSARFIYPAPALLDPIKYGSEGPLDPLDHQFRTDRVLAAPYLYKDQRGARQITTHELQTQRCQDQRRNGVNGQRIDQ